MFQKQLPIFRFYRSFLFELSLLLTYLNFCPDFLDHVVKKLNQKAKVNFKTSFIDWEINYYHANIAQYLTKWNHSNNETCQLIEYSIRIIFLEKSYIVYGWETSPRSFSKKSNLSISLDQDSAQSAQSCTVCFCI